MTTIVSFLTNLTSPIPANGDFGVVAGIGVGFGLIVMLALLASSRALFDRWREKRGSLGLPRPISGAIPGVGPAVESLGGQLALRPAPFLLAVIESSLSSWALRPGTSKRSSTPATSCPPAARP